jgi:hypothetical protein
MIQSLKKGEETNTINHPFITSVRVKMEHANTTLWCEHHDCLESVISFKDTNALDDHCVSIHSPKLETVNITTSQSCEILTVKKIGSYSSFSYMGNTTTFYSKGLIIPTLELKRKITLISIGINDVKINLPQRNTINFNSKTGEYTHTAYSCDTTIMSKFSIYLTPTTKQRICEVLYEWYDLQLA